MYLFTRRVRARSGGIGEAMAWATGITEQVRQITGLDVSLFAEVYGPKVGSLAWSAVVPDLVALEAASDKLAVDEGYLATASKGQQFAPDGPQDRLLQFIHPQPEAMTAAQDAPPFGYATVVSSVCAPGSLRRGLELGVQIAERVTQIVGSPTAFLVDTTGAYGGVNWITGHADAASLEAANAALAADEDWLRFIDAEVIGVYADDPAVTEQLLYRRVV